MTRYEAQIDKEWESLGLANLVIARVKADGATDMAHLLVDVFCLGVKDALMVSDVSEEGYRALLKEVFSDGPSETIHPACARKLVEGAVAYAESLGFAPHRDFRKARRVFSGVDAAACPRNFTYGLNGRPHYIPGPDDSDERINRVLTILAAKFGPEGFGYDDPGDMEDDEDDILRAELTGWLAAEPVFVPRFYEFSGLVTGLLLNPTPVTPLKILEVLWGPDGRTWKDQAELQDFTELLMDYWNLVNGLIDACVDPRGPEDMQCMDVWEDDFAENEGPHLIMALRDWCAGFRRAVDLWSPADSARLDAPALAPHWEVVRVFARFESEGHRARIDAMTQENPPRRLGSSVTALARGLRQQMP